MGIRSDYCYMLEVSFDYNSDSEHTVIKSIWSIGCKMPVRQGVFYFSNSVYMCINDVTIRVAVLICGMLHILNHKRPCC